MTRGPLEVLQAELAELDPDVLAALATPVDDRVKNRIVSRLRSEQRARRRARRALATTSAFAVCVTLMWVVGLDTDRERLRVERHHDHTLLAAQAAEATRLTREAERLRDQRRYDQAVERLERALEIREHALGPDHLEVAANLTELAELYRTQQLPAKAELLYRRAYAIQPAAVF